MVLDVTKIIFGNKSIEMALTNISSGLRICQVDIRKEIPGPKTGKLKPVATNFYRATRHCNGNFTILWSLLDKPVDSYQDDHKRCHPSSRYKQDPKY